MKVLNWGVSAVAALLLAGGSSYASNTDELSAMKATMENMKQEMEAMRSTISAERDALRANAGGAPEGLKSANGKATIAIGGEFKVRYNYGWLSNYADSDNNQRRARSSWDLDKAQIDFKLKFTPDTSALVSLRVDRATAGIGNGQILDQAWWLWQNIGGTGFALKVGLQKLDYGMFNGEQNPWGRVMILDPFVKDSTIGSTSNIGSTQSTTSNARIHDQDITSLGVTASYKWDQFKMVAGLMADQNYLETDMGVTGNGETRNNGLINHYFTFYYDPCWLEGMHFQAGYLGKVDNGQGNTTLRYDPFDYYNTPGSLGSGQASSNNGGYYGGSNYNANFDFGVFYKADCWALYAEVVGSANPKFIKGAYQYAMSVGADYSITEKFSIGGTFDAVYTTLDRVAGIKSGVNANGFNEWTWRGALGAKYDFGNGLYVQAQYSHFWTKAYGMNDTRCKDYDLITFQTGFKF